MADDGGNLYRLTGEMGHGESIQRDPVRDAAVARQSMVQEYARLKQELAGLRQQKAVADAEKAHLANKVHDLQNLLDRVAEECEHNLSRAMGKYNKSQAKVEDLKNNLETVHQNGSHFDKIGDFWCNVDESEDSKEESKS
eukprot:CAMPEP_0115033108 /NCGR_PEP_ID=MMETSP0216-20121206/39620_1 /TAXON_ID=223996 /ORGANISM="Protocruzia adherens, Strain Boccale" /LENGTH=139 /DNA_ID=CAMNT_0002411261 /DNA_START=40 /DNA_END=459 /DNA_ORIENTATION=-